MTPIPNLRPEQFERSRIPAYKEVEYAAGRVCAYIALPVETPRMDIEEILWWSKSRQRTGEWMLPTEERYLVYLIFVKSKYIHHVTEELPALGGFYLRKTEDTIWNDDT